MVAYGKCKENTVAKLTSFSNSTNAGQKRPVPVMPLNDDRFNAIRISGRTILKTSQMVKLAQCYTGMILLTMSSQGNMAKVPAHSLLIFLLTTDAVLGCGTLAGGLRFR
ncbi:hypothetical protein KIN20_001913 [Parelaphostrongylus tenuis]|uniref:Uncharacterized protein n=1 Tax=Parelaphostrongylus tenuis TaxID=148309 RepID=A0AAD5MMT6_PARTN|nr:hypothetical protein KIN20_001913 [Parelaphostrongylus tenuis]